MVRRAGIIVSIRALRSAHSKRVPRISGGLVRARRVVRMRNQPSASAPSNQQINGDHHEKPSTRLPALHRRSRAGVRSTQGRRQGSGLQRQGVARGQSVRLLARGLAEEGTGRGVLLSVGVHAGCNIQAHTFSENKDKFDAAGASVIGVSLDSIERLNDFSADPNYCAGKVAVASDPSGTIAKSFDLMVGAAREGAKDSRGTGDRSRLRRAHDVHRDAGRQGRGDRRRREPGRQRDEVARDRAALRSTPGTSLSFDLEGGARRRRRAPFFFRGTKPLNEARKPWRTPDELCSVTGAAGQLGKRVVELLLDAKAGRVDRDHAYSREAHGSCGARRRDAQSGLQGFRVAARGLRRRRPDASDQHGRSLPARPAARPASRGRRGGGRRGRQAHLVHVGPAPYPIAGGGLIDDHFWTEQAIFATPLEWTILRHQIYMDTLLMSLPQAAASGQLHSSMGNGASNYVTREDCARADAATLASDFRRPANSSTSQGPKPVTQDDVAAIASG